jgi:hypothetical protein
LQYPKIKHINVADFRINDQPAVKTSTPNMEEQTTSEPAPVNARGQVFGIIFYAINGTSPDHCSFSLFKSPTSFKGSKDCASETMCLIFGINRNI